MLSIMGKDKDKEVVNRRFVLEYSSESNIYMTVLKGYKKGYRVRVELFADNIHCQRINDLKLTLPFKIWGFIKFDEQDKIPIAYGYC
jgi:hypothetical protein